MQFEWDEKKNLSNEKKHGVDFKTASFVFNDRFLLSEFDYRFSYFEERWKSIGRVEQSLIYVAHTLMESEDEKKEEIIRIITARKASPNEARRYYFNRDYESKASSAQRH